MMPALYLSHGAPPVFNDPHWMNQLFVWSRSLPKPAAILIVSAHWEAAPLALSASSASTPLIYDFSGFGRRYFEMTYPTPDASALAAKITALMSDTEPVHEHPSRGLDHGAWVPLKVMYPYADVPVLQLSMPTHDPDRLLRIGQQLRTLREEGVLIIGSGYMTHGLPFLGRDSWEHNVIPGWSRDFDAWAAEALAAGRIDLLADFRHAPGMPYAHPTTEHFAPLFVALGAATKADEAPDTKIDGYWYGLAKRSIELS
jgi:4,5-DOPA dioxygenase extradiol